MTLFQVVVLAVVQGVTEFLPISSTAHLALAPWLLGWPDQGLGFDIALHLGTLVAILSYFFRDWVQVAAQGFGLRRGKDTQLKQNPRLLWFMAVATVPIGVLGFLFKDQAETAWRNPLVIGGMLIGVGVLMEVVDRIGNHRKDMGRISFFDSIFIGLAQAIAIIPGTSRSGITIIAARTRGIDRASAARFSFLLSTPAIAGAVVKAIWDLVKEGGLSANDWLYMSVGVVVSAITGWLVIAFFLSYLRKNTLRFFVYYRIIFGIIVIALAVFVRAPAG